MSSAVYQLETPVFTGPLDLLLHLIERQELDITAISLAQVTAQYLAHVAQMRGARMEHLIDFIVIGARLALIKSRALLPQTPLQVSEEEEEDPRRRCCGSSMPTSASKRPLCGCKSARRPDCAPIYGWRRRRAWKSGWT